MIRDYDLKYSSTLSRNDVSFASKFLMISKRIAFINENLYVYRQCHNDKSITSNRILHSEDIIEVLKELYDWMTDHSLESQYLSTFCKKVKSNIHLYSSNSRNDKFAEVTADYLASYEPWKSMDDNTLLKTAGLLIAPKKIKKLIPKKIKNKEKITKQIDSKIYNCNKIREFLNTKHNRNIKPSFIKELYLKIQDEGIDKELEKLKEKDRNK